MFTEKRCPRSWISHNGQVDQDEYVEQFNDCIKQCCTHYLLL